MDTVTEFTEVKGARKYVQEAGGIANSLNGTPVDVTANGVLVAAARLHNTLHESRIAVIKADT
jgi:fructose-1,6-bisphosphatase/inositol monophosphatase family enzyme